MIKLKNVKLTLNPQMYPLKLCWMAYYNGWSFFFLKWMSVAEASIAPWSDKTCYKQYAPLVGLWVVCLCSCFFAITGLFVSFPNNWWRGPSMTSQPQPTCFLSAWRHSTGRELQNIEDAFHIISAISSSHIGNQLLWETTIGQGVAWYFPIVASEESITLIQ